MFLEVRPTCVLLEVVNLATITQVAQSGSSPRLSICIFLNTLYKLRISPYIVEPRAFIEIGAGCVLLEAANLPKIADAAENGSVRRLPRHLDFNSLYKLTLFAT